MKVNVAHGAHTDQHAESQQRAVIKGFCGAGGSIRTTLKGRQSILVTQYTVILHSLWPGIYYVCGGGVGKGETTRDTEKQLAWSQRKHCDCIVE